MNIIVMHTHDSGRFWQPYGYGVAMPNTMELAGQGILLREAYCAAPTCSPSRAAMLTGMSAHSSGMLGLAHRGFSLNDKRKTMPSWFSAHGYETVLCGVQHEARKDSDLGYERILPATPWLGVTQDQDAWDARNASLVCSYLQEPHTRPFFLSYGMVNTHRPYTPHETKSINPAYVQVPCTVADTAENRSDMADYHASAMAVDECVGTVVRALKETGLWEETIILLTTDHGIAFPFMKCSLYDAGIGVAMVMRYPGMPRAGTACDQLVSQIDVFPTLCELAGIPKPDWLQGVSMLPALEHEEPIRSEVFAEITYHAAYEPVRCIRTRRYKLIIRFDEYAGVVAPNIDNSPSKQALKDAGYMERSLPSQELYDLAVDPCERCNLADAPRLKAVYEDLIHRLHHWMEETEDPLLTHPLRIPAPDGAIVNRQDGYDPETTPLEIS